MTVRAVILGLLISIALASFGYVNDTWFLFSYIGGDLVPIYAFGLLLIGLLAVNPFLRLLRLWQFSSAEWVVILSLSLMGSVIAGSALLWQFPHPIITPIQDQAKNPEWKTKNLLQYVPDIMMVDVKPTPNEPEPKALDDYFKGMGKKGHPIGLRDVPWDKWAPTLSFWFALLALSFTAGICAVIVVHRQWAEREHLSYPIVTFANELLQTEPGRAWNPIFRQKGFWIGCAVALVVLSTKGMNTWFKSFPAISMQVDCTALRELEIIKPFLKVPEAQRALRIEFYFAAIGLAYFLSSEASFSLGISGWLYLLAAAPLVARGVDMSRGFLSGGLPSYMYFGAYLGMGIMVVYLGRRFYWAVLKRMLFIPDKAADVLPREAWAARIGAVVCLLEVLLLWHVGLHPLLGAMFVALTGLLFLMLGRINASTGLFLIQPFWNPVAIILGIFGAVIIGPTSLIILAMLCTMVTIDTRIAAVPLALNALRLGDTQKVKSGRLGGWMAAAIIISMIIAVLFTVWVIYNYGVHGVDSPGTRWALAVARMPFQMLERNLNKLTGDQLELARAPVTLSRLLKASRAKHFLTAVSIGLALVIGCSWLRLRFPRWPLHPVVFLVWGTPWMIAYAPSFLLAWLLKSLILKYGGQKSYIRARGFFVGLVAGEFAAAMIWAAVGVIYFLKTGRTGETFLVRP